jgi:uncharacterized protein (DUF1684 family)
MKIKLIILGVITLSLLKVTYAQPKKSEYEKEIIAFQNELNAEFADKEESCLLPKDLRKFRKTLKNHSKGLDFFPIDENFKVVAKFVRTANEIPFKMKTTTDRLPIYKKYGEAHFTLNEKQFILSIYQNQKLIKKEKYKDHLFVAYNDLTNGNESYGGGRFLDFKIPDGDAIIIDFNKSYNPLCSYNHSYSCPIPPKENYLEIEIKAGVKVFEKH